MKIGSRSAVLRPDCSASHFCSGRHRRPHPQSDCRRAAFRRTERVAVEWPLSGAIDRREARLLGRDGRPLLVDVTLNERSSSGVAVLAADLNLAPLTAGDYVIEVTAGAGASAETKLVAIRVVR
jgi:hypothetical protein